MVDVPDGSWNCPFCTVRSLFLAQMSCCPCPRVSPVTVLLHLTPSTYLPIQLSLSFVFGGLRSHQAETGFSDGVGEAEADPSEFDVKAIEMQWLEHDKCASLEGAVVPGGCGVSTTRKRLCSMVMPLQ